VNPDEVGFRLLRGDDVPAINPLNLAYRFGLQDTKQESSRENGSPTVPSSSISPSRQSTLSFARRFASGPVDDRFVYLSWGAIERGHYINRVRARLAAVD